MKNSLIILAFFVFGILGGVSSFLPRFILESDFSFHALCLLLFLVGIGIGSDVRAWRVIKEVNVKIVLVPLSVIIGTLSGVGLFSFLVPDVGLRESLAVGSGFGYYSLSSILITQIRGEVLGVIALLSNISREIVTLLITPILAKYLGKLAPIASGGATAMDTTLPVIAKFTGKEYAMIAFFSGVVLTIIVPFLIALILQTR
jgi:uncharacterized membrane protein YbjE (DUF340 family)